MGPDSYSLGPGKIYINGTEFIGEGLTDYNYEDFEPDTMDYLKKSVVFDKHELTCTFTVNRITVLKVMGIWDWVRENCPNGRVKHLIKYGKNDRVRYKNFKRAVKMVAKCVKEV